MEKLLQSLSILINNNIHHVDLHPGNVLVDIDNNVFIIDFDKAHYFSKSKKKLKKKYFYRWKRAIIKHGLPHMLNEIMYAGLF